MIFSYKKYMYAYSQKIINMPKKNEFNDYNSKLMHPQSFIKRSSMQI